MWLAALAALAVGGPFGACLFLAAGITACIRAWKVDGEAVKRGDMPPTASLINKWLEGRNARRAAQGKAPQQPAKYGMWRYAWQRWLAMWELAAAQHQAQHQQRLQQIADGTYEKTDRPSLREQAQAGWQWVVDAIGVPLGKLTPRRPATMPAAEPVTADGPIIACPDCGATLIDDNGGWQHPEGSTCPSASQPAPTPEPVDADRTYTLTCPGCGATDPSTVDPATLTRQQQHCPNCRTDTANQQEENVSGHSGPQDAYVREQDRLTASAGITPESTAQQNGANPMTAPSTQQQSGEVTGLQSAINYADAVAAAHGQHSQAGGEQYRASLGRAEVGPETIASAADAQEKSAIAQAAWQRHADMLRQQLAAKEVTTSETGNKQFLLNE